jgi:DNA (cytosine-5)-methyltransferase 1
VECDQYAATILAQRQNDGLLEAFPIWSDVQTFDGRPWRGRVDVISGGFPCQDISVAGKGAGIDGERSGMWRHMARIVDEVRPHFVFVENSPMLIQRGLARVLGDLASMGYDARWGIIGADDAGAPHHRKRIWILAYTMFAREWWKPREKEIKGDVVADPNRARFKQSNHTLEVEPSEQSDGGSKFTNANGAILERCGEVTGARIRTLPPEPGRIYREPKQPNWWEVEPRLGRVAHGVAHRVDRLKSIGNGQVPEVAALAWSILNE